jgi:hypothetical protein
LFVAILGTACTRLNSCKQWSDISIRTTILPSRELTSKRLTRFQLSFVSNYETGDPIRETETRMMVPVPETRSC